MWTFKPPYYFSRFTVDVSDSELDQNGLIAIVQQSFNRFFVVKSCQLTDDKIEVKLGSVLWYVIQGSLLPSVRKFIPLLCEIAFHSVSHISMEIVIEVKPRDLHLNYINTHEGNTYVSDAARAVEHVIKEFLDVSADRRWLPGN